MRPNFEITMGQHLRRMAIALWLLSFVLPTYLQPSGEVALGARVFMAGVSGLFMLPVSIFAAPLQVISFLSNGCVLREMTRQVRQQDSRSKQWHMLLLVAVAALNITMVWRSAAVLPQLWAYPGVYVWAASFVLLAGVAVGEHWEFCLGLARRSAALLAVAALVWAAGLAVIVLLGGA